MIFYRFSCIKKKKIDLVDKKVLDEMVNQDLKSYKSFCEETKDNEIFLFIVQDEVNKLV